MNEKIEVLAKQAGYQLDGFGLGHWNMSECKKFAELIIKECANIADDYDTPKLSGPGMIIANRIKEHFGVE